MDPRSNAAAVCALLCVLLVVPSPAAAVRPDGFLVNEGQVDRCVRFYASAAGATVWFTSDAIVLDARENPPAAGPHARHELESGAPKADRLRGHVVWMQFSGAGSATTIEGRGELRGRTSYFLGDDPDGWRPDIAAYSEIVYRDVWPGVDVSFRLDRGALVYEVRAAPGAEVPSDVFRYEGADQVVDDGDGLLCIVTSVGRLMHRRTGSPLRNGAITAGGEASTPLIDLPETLEWATHVGSSGIEWFNGTAIDASDRPIGVGLCNATEFPTSPGAYQEDYAGGAFDAVVVKLSADGSSLEWCTYLGGGVVGTIGGSDIAYAVTVEPVTDAVYVWGNTNALDFPTTSGCFDSTRAAPATDRFDNFVTKMTADGTALIWSTYLGGGQAEYNFGNIALAPDGGLLVAGNTESGNFPTTPGAFMEDLPTLPGTSGCGYVAKFTADTGFPIWSTFLGGTGEDIVVGLASDADGGALVGVTTRSDDFPTTPGAYDETRNGDWDAALCKVNADGSSLEWSSFFGGTGWDTGAKCVRHPSGDLILSGEVLSGSAGTFPTTSGVFDETHNGESDLFVASFSGDCTTLNWCTYLGGDDIDEFPALLLDGDGAILLGFVTRSTNLPIAWADVLGPYDATYNGGTDMAYARLTPDGRTLLWSTYVGGTGDEGNDQVDHMELASDGYRLVVSNWTSSPDFPATAGAFDETFNGGGYDGVVMRLLAPDATAVTPIAARPERSLLRGIVPNPTRSGSIVHYELSRSGPVVVSVYDPAGRLVRVLEARSREAGPQQIVWDGRSATGLPVAAGVYYVHLKAGAIRDARSVTVLR